MENREAIHKLIMFCRILERGVFPLGYKFDAEPFDLAISALEKQEQDRWIPVTERLPEEDCECRVTSKNNFGKSVFDCYWNEGKKQFESWNYFLDDYVPVSGVTAWKPLEEPYTEEEL